MSVEVTRLLADLQAADGDDDAAVKSCCAAVYGSDVVTLLLGESYHPGGLDLTANLAGTLGLEAGMRVLDVASGLGTTSLFLAAEFGVEVIGVDLGTAQVETARAQAEEAGLSGRAEFRVGDAEHLPVDDGSVDAVICECALCTFPDKEAAAGEMARVLRPGGVAGITDVWLEPDRLEPELSGLASRVACLADARPVGEVVSTVERAGLDVTTTEFHDQALTDTIERVTDRLRMYRMIGDPALVGVDIARGIELARRALAVVERGDAGYLLLTATTSHIPGCVNP